MTNDSPNIHFIFPRGSETWIKIQGEEQTPDLSTEDVDIEMALLQDSGWRVVRTLSEGEHQIEHMLVKEETPVEE